jgi:transposase
VLYAAHAVWAELGIGPLLREKLQQDGYTAPHDTALFAMTANRLARPSSKLACDDHWLADDVYWPAAQTLALEHLYRALDFLLHHIEALEQEMFLRTADLFKADVDLVFWDTTTLYFEIDDEDEEGEPWQTHDIPALRKRGHHKEGRDGNPQVVVGLALTRDGLPVRSWVFPGNTADVTTINHLKDDWQGWRLHRCVFVGDRGMFSEANRQRLSRALGRYMLAVPMRKVTEVQGEVLARPGRYRDVAHHLRVKEVVVGEGERRRRYLVCHNPAEAEREQAHRARLLELVRAELAALDVRQADHPKKACELMASRRFGRYLQLDARGRLRIDTTKVAAAAK